MRRKCPNCGKMPDIPEKGGYCTHCGQYIAPKNAEPPARSAPIADIHCPWEEMEKIGFWKALWSTISGVLVRPTEFFSRMKIGGGIGKPLLFGLLVSSVGSIVNLLWQSGQSLIPMWLNQFQEFSDVPYEEIWPLWLSGPAFKIVMIFLTPLLALLGMFIFSGALHICLFIVGGAKKGFEASFRAVAYAEATSLFYIIPFCGSLIGLVWSIVCTIIGLKETHQISGGKAAFAYFLPTFVCCGFLVFMIILFVGSAGLSELIPNMLD